MFAARVVFVALCALLLASTATAHSDSPFAPASPPRAALEDSSESCLACQAIVTAAGAATQNATEMSELLTALEGDCAKLGGLNTVLCDLAATALVKFLPKAPEKLYDAGFYTPQILCSFFGACSVPCCTDNKPSQIHLSAAALGAAAGTAMTVTWMTADSLADVQVQWGPSADALNSSTSATTSTYTEAGWVGSIHTATMTGLKPGVETFYTVGGPNSGWSEVISFIPFPDELPAGYTFLQVGDMGADRNFSAGNQDYINYAASAKAPPQVAINTVLHVGDISYADGYMERWDELFNALQPTASAMPYMTCPGNHEFYFNFSAYRSRLHMPAAASNATAEGALYYSWDAGCIHFVSINSESVIDTPEVDPQQVAWIAADLAAFNQRRTAARAARTADDATCSSGAPTFAVVYMHRPLYCNAGGGEGKTRCTEQGQYLRGLLEEIFVTNGVDLVFYGHVHAYERMANVYNDAADPKGPVYIMNGVGGNREGTIHSKWAPSPPAWSVTRIGEPGLGTLTVVNSTALYWQFYLQTDLAEAAAQQGVPKPSDAAYIYPH